MFLLIETIIGFSVIMLLLSFLVKSLTSVVKNHINYYAKNMKSEVEHFLRETLEGTLDQIETIKGKDKSGGKEVLAKIPWRRLGEDYLSLENMKELLKKITGRDDYENLEARLKRHQANLKYAFNVQMKNLSLVCGLGLCLFLNINALTIWKTLYTDTQVRAKFSSQKYVTAVLDKSSETETATEKVEGAGQKAETTPEKTELDEEREAWKKELKNFQTDVNFGIGEVWEKESQDKSFKFFLFQFLGSLLTGILVSIGAPYWHDLLRTLNSISVGKRKGVS